MTLKKAVKLRSTVSLDFIRGGFSGGLRPPEPQKYTISGPSAGLFGAAGLEILDFRGVAPENRPRINLECPGATVPKEFLKVNDVDVMMLV